MVTLDELVAFLDTYLGRTELVARIDPHMANGLQVRGRESVQVVITGVSASLRFFAEAVASGADAMIVHHALNLPAGIHLDHVFSRRLRYLFEHELSLIGYHYLLDSHPELGNNAQIIRKLGGTLVEPYPPDGWGWVGELEGGVERDALLNRCTALFSQHGVHYSFGPDRVQRVVALSGAGAPRAADMEWLMSHHIDLFITGEPREYNRELFREAGISLVAAGHYHTERLGIQALSEVLRRNLDVAVEFLDLPNSV
jgi:dinuclear metal center YbgI/SA1388 family protein